MSRQSFTTFENEVLESSADAATNRPNRQVNNDMIRSPRFGNSNLSTPRGGTSPRPTSPSSPPGPLSPNSTSVLNVNSDQMQRRESNEQDEFEDPEDPDQQSKHPSDGYEAIHTSVSSSASPSHSSKPPSKGAVSLPSTPTGTTADPVKSFVELTQHELALIAAAKEKKGPEDEVTPADLGDGCASRDMSPVSVDFQSAVSPSVPSSPNKVEAQQHQLQYQQQVASLSIPQRPQLVMADDGPNSSASPRQTPRGELKSTHAQLPSIEQRRCSASESPTGGRISFPGLQAQSSASGQPHSPQVSGKGSFPDSGKNNMGAGVLETRGRAKGKGKSPTKMEQSPTNSVNFGAFTQNNGAMSPKIVSPTRASGYTDENGDVFYDCEIVTHDDIGGENNAWRGWILVIDESRMFYYHESTGATQWQCPKELYDVLGEWVSMGSQGTRFWFNNKARISVWHDPNEQIDVFDAAYAGNSWFIELFVHFGGDLCIEHPESKATPLHYAIAGGSALSVQTIIRLGPQNLLNELDMNGQSALCWSVHYGYWNLCKMLVDARCSQHLIEKAFEIAQSLGRTECQTVLQPSLGRRVSFADEQVPLSAFPDDVQNDNNFPHMAEGSTGSARSSGLSSLQDESADDESVASSRGSGAFYRSLRSVISIFAPEIEAA